MYVFYKIVVLIRFSTILNKLELICNKSFGTLRLSIMANIQRKKISTRIH